MNQIKQNRAASFVVVALVYILATTVACLSIVHLLWIGGSRF